MGTVGQTARIKLTGFDTEGIDERSPLEDQVALTYRAALEHARSHGFKPYVHRGVSGLAGPMVMKRLTDALFNAADSEERSKINGLVTQVLRKTDACVCVRRAPDGDRETMPEWFVADRMPANLTIVALNHKHKDPIPAPNPLVPTHREAKLTPDEAGENLPPGEVTVRHGEPKRPINPSGGHEVPQATLNAFEEQQRLVAEQHRRLVEEVYQAVERHAPIGAQELKHILPHLMDGPSGTAIVAAVRELGQAGRLVSRVEEDAERLIRGGGAFPKGKRVKLWAPAPGPVPQRRKLPDGVPAVKGAAQWEREKKEQLDAHCDKIIEELSRAYPKGTPSRPRSTGALAKVTGLTLDETKAALSRLLRLELVYDNGHYSYYLADRKRGKNKETEPAPAPAPQPETEPVIAPYVNGSPEQNAARDRAQGNRGSQGQAPAVLPPAELAAEVAALIARHTDGGRVAQLEAELERTAAENLKLQRQVTALKRAIADME